MSELDTQPQTSTATETAAEAPAHEVLLTDLAAGKVKSLLAQEGREDL
ncbi:MAG: iron-sulfur cluster insertion protein ErpA, partial [Knoellia sp.]